MAQTETQTRICGLDLIKDLGLILVIYYHITWQYPPDIVTSTHLRDFLHVFLQTFLCCCVPLFFMSSGALALSRPISLKKNSLRCAHLFLVTVFWVVLCLGVVLLLQGQRVSPKEFLRIALELRVGYIQHLWYLPNFLFLTLMVPVLYALKTGNRQIYTYFIWMIAIFTMGTSLLNDGEYVLRWILGKYGYAGYRTSFWYVDFFRYHYWYIFVYFALGDYMMEHGASFRKSRLLLLLIILLSMGGLTITTVAISRVQGYVYNFVFNNYGSVFTVTLSGAVSLLLQDLKPAPILRKLSASLAKCSLGIYIIHWLVWGAFVRLMPTVMADLSFAIPMTLVIGCISWGITALGLKLPIVRNLFTASPQWLRKFRDSQSARG